MFHEFVAKWKQEPDHWHSSKSPIHQSAMQPPKSKGCCFCTKQNLVLHRLANTYSTVWQLSFPAFCNIHQKGCRDYGKLVWTYIFLTILWFYIKSIHFIFICPSLEPMDNNIHSMVRNYNGWHWSSISICYMHQPVSEPMDLACSSCKIYGKLLCGMTK